MGFWSRVRSVVGIRPRGSSQRPNIEIPGAKYARLGGDYSTAPRRGTQELFQLYRSSPWMHAVENTLANGCATATKLRLFDGPNDDDQRVRIGRDDPRYAFMRAWRRPVRLGNGRLMSTRMRNKLLALWYWMAGEAFLVKLRLGGPGGLVIGYVPVSPLWMLSLPTRLQPYYTMQMDAAIPALTLAPEDVVPIIDPDVVNPCGRGVGVAASLDDELDTYEHAAKLLRARFLNHGAPDGLIVLEGASSVQAEKTREAWHRRHGGADQAGQLEFVTGKADFIDLSADLGRGNVLACSDHERNTIIQVHGISPELFGILEGSTRDSVDAAEYHKALHVEVPWLETVADALQAHAAGDFASANGEIWVGYQNPIPEDRQLKLKAIATAPSAFRVRDVREVGGFAPDAERDDLPLTEKAIQAGPTNLPDGKPGPTARKNGRQNGHADPAWTASLAVTPTSVVGSES